jgi:hypothetical protein
MGVNRGISGGTRQVLIFSVRDMEMRLGVTVFLCETKVDHVDLVTAFSDAHQEVVRFNVAVDKGLGMDIFDP